jgi:proteasome lid subunit RPN8/RPN11
VSETVRFEPSVLRDVKDHAAASYPHEACGALLGRGGSVSCTLPLPNRAPSAREVRFEVSPRDYLKLESEAERLGLDLLGFWHSHPEGLALPSATDRACAWEGLLTVIVSVEHRVPGEITAWIVPGPDLPFTEVPVEDGHALVTSLAAIA